MVVPLKRRRPHVAAASQVVPLGRAHEANDTTIDDDAARESRLDGLRIQFLTARSPDQRRELWAAIKREISARSPAQVDRMERERGLRREGC